MSLPHAIQKYVTHQVCSQILQNSYQEMYEKIFLEKTEKDSAILIVNQGVYISFLPYFDSIQKRDLHVTYIDQNEDSIALLNEDIRGFCDRSAHTYQYLQTLFEAIPSSIYRIQSTRLKDLFYDTIVIHHMNVYLPTIEGLMELLQSVTKRGATIIFYATIAQNEKSMDFKNAIRNWIAEYTNLRLGDLCTLDELLQKIPQNHFTVERVIPYRQSVYLGYGRNDIYQFTLRRK
jgi:hypothetical protein